MKYLLQAVLLPAVLATSLFADTICLKDGSKLEGNLKHTDDGWIVTTNGKTSHVTSDQVQSIELTPAKDIGPRLAAERLSSLRRSVENLDDLPEIILRYHRFIDQINDQATSSEAKKDLTLWEDRLNQKMVKIGSRWILPADRARLIDEATILADQARQLMKQGRTKEAEPILSTAIEDDPQNISALYLLGLLRYQQEKIIDARKALDLVASLIPNHAPTLNNLAVVQWRQRQYAPALVSYDGAMLAWPGNKLILDNVAYALAGLPAIYKNTPVAQRVTRHFQEQDKLLAEQMALSGLHRHGTTWISDADFQRLQQQDKEKQAKLDAMSAEFDKIKDRVTEIDRNIEDTESQMHRIEASSYARDPTTGAMLQLPYPTVYYDLDKDDKRMQADRAKEVKKMDALQQAARALQQPAAAGKIVDLQQMIGPEGTPVRTVATTQATTQPAGS
jgi:tetratricopeptide (TPR) repeat protein